jgi:acyl transferase domain-containing protein/acyl carrier protein/short-subunit dehydrogenase involved in D-alanine esterification of teichoic acids
MSGQTGRQSVHESVVDLWRLALAEVVAPDEPIPHDVPFRDLGGDSNAAIALALLLEEEFGPLLGRNVAYDHPTVAAQVDSISARLLPRPAKRPADPVAVRESWPEHAIAVVSSSVRVPGAGSVPEFWDLMDNGRCVIGTPPSGRQHRETGGYLDDVAGFDYKFFGISRTDAVSMDPQQRQALELAWEALESAGYGSAGGRPQSVGVFVGATRPDFDDLVGADARLNGCLVALIANRISYSFDLTGPSECVDTACSSSLVAVHRASTALLAGDCDMALAGGVSLILTDRRFRLMRANKMISPTGRCRPFTDGADGIVPGEGGGFVLLKRMADAVRDGDAVLGVLIGSAVNNDGRSNGINAPHPDRQREVVRAAWARAGVDPGCVTYIEAHGTGTSTGDAVELGALRDCLAGGPPGQCGIGSVKGNIGHLEWAAGVAGLIKVLLALQHERLPASGSFGEPSREADLDNPDNPMFVVERSRPWRGRRVAGVSSFGAGGTNCHVVVESPAVQASTSHSGAALLTISARSESALRARLAGIRDVLHRSPNVGHLVAAASSGRGDFSHRFVRLVTAAADLDVAPSAGECRTRPADGVDGVALLLSGDDRAALAQRWLDRGLRPQFTVAAGMNLIRMLDTISGTTTEHTELGEVAVLLAAAGVRHLVCLDTAEPAAAWEQAGVRIHVALDPARTERVVAADVVTELYLAGHDVSLDGPVRAAELPTYPFEREPCWPATASIEPARETDDVRAFVCQWAPVDDVVAEVPGDDAVLIFADGTGVAELLAHRLRAAGCAVAIHAQSPLAGTVPDDWLTDESSLDQLLLNGSGTPVRQVVWLTGLPDGADRSWPMRVHRVPGALLSLARAFARRSTQSPCRLIVATAGALSAVPDAAQHMVAGVVPTLRREMPGLDVRLVDLDPLGTPVRWSAELATTVLTTSPHLVWRDGVPNRPQWTELRGGGQSSLVRRHGAYLITGGVGALGVATCEWLSASEPVHLHLVTRREVGQLSETAADPLLARLARLSTRGSTVTVHSADVGDPYHMAEVVTGIRKQRGRIDGVVHTAGILDDRAIAGFDLRGFGRRLHAKVAGAIVLDDLFQLDDLDFFLLYSSAISHVGNPGQAEYAAANRFLDALAAARRDRGLPALSISWSTWDGPGMAADSGFLLRSAELGLRPIQPRDALAALERVLPTGAAAVCIAVDPPGEQTVLAPPTRKAEAQRAGEVLEMIAGALRTRLGDDVDLDANLFDVGATSLDLLAMIDEVNGHWGIDAAPTVAFEAPTARRLATLLAEFVPSGPSGRPAPAGISSPITHTGALTAAERPAGVSAEDEIAVIGLSCRFAGANTPEELWRLLVAGRTAIRPAGPSALLGTATTGITAALLGRPYDFDPLTFRISPAEAPWVDPQQRLALELAWEALERAGRAGGDHARTGVFLGAEPTRYADHMPTGRYSAVGGANTNCLVANRVSYVLRLGGPSLVCDTACSSSGVAIHLARTSLLSGDCDLALAGGVKLLLDHRGFEVNAKAGLLSPSGRLHAFGTDADGYVRGEGGAIVVLKRLSDALSDGDEILAVLKGSQVGHDAGDKVGLTAPSPGAQRELLTRTWQRAGLAPDRLAFIEAHGTGTALGDPVEVSAISGAMRDYSVRTTPWLGSVKTNLGHTEAAAGAASFVKAVLSLRAGVFPPHPATGPDPGLASAGLRLPTEPVSLPRRAQAVVSAFGFGGMNTHFVLEQASSVHNASDRGRRRTRLVPVSARTATALDTLCRNLAGQVGEVQIADVAATLALGRQHFENRRAFVVSDVAELVRGLRSGAPGHGAGYAEALVVRIASIRRPSRDAIADLVELAPARVVLDHADPVGWLDRLWATDPQRAQDLTRAAMLAVVQLARIPLAEPGTGGLEIDLGGDQPLRDQVLTTLATLYEAHVDIDWDALWSGSPVRRVCLPTYPFERQTYGPLTVEQPGDLAAAEVVWESCDWSAVTRAGERWRLVGGTERQRAAVTGRLDELGLVAAAETDADVVVWFLPAPTGARDDLWADVLDSCRQVTKAGRVIAVGWADGHPTQSAVAGLVRGLADETPNLDVSLVWCADPETLADRLQQVPRRGEYRLVGQPARKTVRPVTVSATGPVAGTSGVVLVTGGLGGVGGHLAIEYARAGAKDVVLLGRSVPPDDHPMATAVRAAGARVRVLAADVSDRNQLAAALTEVRRSMGRISAVVHAAGVFDHVRRSLRAKTTESVASVLAAKLDGTMLLDELLADDPPDVVLLCSSLSVVGSGMAGGQADYAAANSFVDAYAESRRDTRTRVVAVGWPQWANLGMSAGRSLPEPVKAAGLTELSVEAGVAAFRTLLASDVRGCVTVLGRTGEHAEGVARLNESRPEPVPDPGGIVRRALAGVLAVEPSSVDDHVSFLDLGLDSLGIADLAGALESVTGAVVDPADILLYPTVAALSGRLAGRAPVTVRIEEQPVVPPSYPTAIAVIGVAGLFPGASSVGELWDLLRTCGNAVGTIPSARWDWRAHYDEVPGPGTTVSKWGGFLDAPGAFDAEHFGMSRAHAAMADPLQRLFLEVSWSALRDAGQLRGNGVAARGGIFVGARATGAPDEPVSADLAREAVVGNAQNFIAARVAHHLDLRGPAMVVDTACSSSLVAVHLAARSLLAGECEIAVAGGVDLLAGPQTYVSLSAAKALSPHGRCATFSADADGYVPGEGAGAVVLKPLDAAMRDGDRIYAVLRGSAMNNDGRTIGLTTPNIDAQRDVLRTAYRDADVDPATVGLIEAHGTGTSIGDPIEVRALAEILGSDSRSADCVLGTVKTNLGHLHSAAGIVGLLKAVLCLHHQVRVPSLHCATPNPRLNLGSTPFRLLAAAENWDSTGIRRAGVSAFGFGGTNCHVVLEQAPALATRNERGSLVLLSARSPAVLRREAAALLDWSTRTGVELADYARLISDGRGAFPYRVVLRGTTELPQLMAELAETDAGPAPTLSRPVFLFPGQGAQYPGMARELLARDGRFAAAMAECASWLDPHLDRPLMRTLSEDGIRDTSVLQPVMFAVEYAFDRMWRALGVEPFAVVGHSIGEFAAMVSAGILTGPDAAFLVAHRARLMGSCRPGAMLGVQLSERRLAEVLDRFAEVDVAAVNGPASTVLSGETATIKSVTEFLRGQKISVFPLRVSHAFHSRLMDPAVAALTELAGGVRFESPQDVTLFSTVTGAAVSKVDAGYIGGQLRSPVRYAAAVGAARQAGGDMFLEVGPGRTLSKLAAQSLEPGALVVGGPTCAESERTELLDAVAELWRHGYEVRTGQLQPLPRAAGVLPPYPFERVDLGLRTTVRPRPAPVTNWAGTRQFRAGEPVMDDHTVGGHRILPGVSWITMAAQALADAGHSAFGTYRDISFLQPLTVSPDKAALGTVDLQPSENGWRFTGFSDGRREHVRGRFEPGTLRLGRLDIPALWRQFEDESDGERLYERIRGQGIVHGPFYRCLRRARANRVEAVAELALSDVAGNDGLPLLHPALLDGATTVGAALPSHAPWATGHSYIPFHIASVQVAGALPQKVMCHYRTGRLDGELAVFDFDICTDDGTVLVSARGFASKRVPARWRPVGARPSLIGRVRWVPVVAEEASVG